jgi:TPR repeat protein
MLRRHVENEVPEAIRVLGMHYFTGVLGLMQSYKKSAKLFKRAVELGNVSAMINLSGQYFTGRGVKLDRTKGKQLLRLAAKRHSATAQKHLAGELRDDGCHEEAFAFIKMAAEQGEHEAENDLGMHYVHGIGVTRNFDEARRWFSLAAAKGHEKAALNLEEFKPWLSAS